MCFLFHSGCGHLFAMPYYKIFPNLFVCKVTANIVGVFHPITLKTTFIRSNESNAFLLFMQSPKPFSPRAVQPLLAKTNTNFTALLDARIFVTAQYDYMRSLAKIRDAVILKPPQLRVCYFIVSEACNLNCKYCFIESGIPFTHIKKKMTPKVALASATYFAFNAKRCCTKPVANFYGGEPLMNFPAVKLITRILRSYDTHVEEKVRSDISMVTNGTLITPAIARFLAKNNVHASVSIDGPRHIHDKERVYAGGARGSFAHALRGYTMLKEAGANPGVSFSIAAHNLDYVPEIVEYFYTKLKPSGVGANILFSLNEKGKRDLDMDKLSMYLIRAYEILHNYGIYEDRVGRHLTPEGNIKPYYADCAGCGDQLVFLPEGKVCPCHAFLPSRKYSFGDVCGQASRDYMTHPISWLWRKRSPVNIAECQRCPAVSVCGGGCAANVYVAKGSLFRKDERNCTFFLKHFLRWYVHDRYTASLKKKEVVDGKRAPGK